MLLVTKNRFPCCLHRERKTLCRSVCVTAAGLIFYLRHVPSAVVNALSFPVRRTVVTIATSAYLITVARIESSTREEVSEFNRL